MPEEPVANPSLLALLPSAEDCSSLESILGCVHWDLRFTQTFEEMRAALHAHSFNAVITEGSLANGRSWKDVLNEIHRMAAPPPLIVTDRLADERLWAEVLNLGAYDLISKPFVPREVLHVVHVVCGVSNGQRLIPKRPPSSERRATFVAGASGARAHH